MEPNKSKNEEIKDSSECRHGALDELRARVEARYRDEQERNKQRNTKAEVEKEHARYLRSTYGGNTSGTSKPQLGSDQSNQHGRQTIGVDARVNMGKAVFGMLSSSATSTDALHLNTDSVVHPTALSISERLQQQIADVEPTQQAEAQAVLGAASHTNHTASVNESDPCPVMNCDIVFSSHSDLAHHMEESHSPCNPCRHLRRGKLQIDINEFVCPVCLLKFKSYSSCFDHMVAMEHKALHSPMSVAAYACPHCLLIFPSHRLCTKHIHDSNHHAYAYAFKDDVGRTVGKPIPMPAAVLEEFIGHCKQVGWVLECITCEKKIDTAVMGGKAEVAPHLQEQHLLMATTDLTPGEVFGLHMIKSYTCVQCLRLFDSLPEGDAALAVHECRLGTMGAFVEASSDCSTFEQYIIRYALRPLVQSVTSSASRSIICPSKSQGSNSGAASMPQDTGQQPQSGGVYIPPHDGVISYGPLNTVATSAHSDNPPLHPVEFRSTGLFNTPLYRNSDSILTRSVSGSDVLGKAPIPNAALLSDSSDSTFPCFAKSSSLSAKFDSNDNEPDLYYGSDVSSDQVSSSISGTSRYSFVTCASHQDKRAQDDSDSGSPPPKKRRMSDLTKLCNNASTDDEHVDVEITSSMENVSMLMLDTKDWNAAAKRKKGPGKKKKKVQTVRIDYASDSSHSNDGWLQINQQNNKSKPSAKKHDGSSRNKKQKITPAAGNSSKLSAEDLEIFRLFSKEGKPHGFERDRRLTEVDSLGESSSRPVCVPDSQACKSLRVLSPSKAIQTSSSLVGVYDHAPALGLLSPAPNIPDGLESMQHIVFLDLDNWRGFWTKLPRCLPERTFVWGFYGGQTSWTEPRGEAFLFAKTQGLWHIHKKCSKRKDAADFAICLMVGKLDERLPKHIPFTILSGDHGFLELEEQMRCSRRRATVINPHHRSDAEVYTLICSVGDV